MNANISLLEALIRSKTFQSYERTGAGTQVVTRRKPDAVSDLLAMFAERLGMSSDRFMFQALNVERPVITKVGSSASAMQNVFDAGTAGRAVNINLLFLLDTELSANRRVHVVEQ